MKKQLGRQLSIFLDKLKNTKITFLRDISHINKQMVLQPILSDEVLETLNKRYNMGIKKDDFAMKSELDRVGLHQATVRYNSEEHNKIFNFFITIEIKPSLKSLKDQEE